MLYLSRHYQAHVLGLFHWGTHAVKPGIRGMSISHRKSLYIRGMSISHRKSLYIRGMSISHRKSLYIRGMSISHRKSLYMTFLFHQMLDNIVTQATIPSNYPLIGGCPLIRLKGGFTVLLQYCRWSISNRTI